MKTLIVYYSLTGNTKWLANKIADSIPCSDVFEIKINSNTLIPKRLNYFWYSVHTLIGLDMSINQLELDLSQYDNVIIGGPVWLNRAASPLRTFLKQVDLDGKKLHGFCTSASGYSKSFFDDIRRFSFKKKLESTLSVKEPLNQYDSNVEKSVKKFISEFLLRNNPEQLVKINKYD